MTFAELAVLVLAQRTEDGVRGIKSERHRYKLHVSKAAFINRELADIRRVDLIDWTREMSNKKARDSRGDRTLSRASVARSFALVRAVFATAIERGLIEVDPCDGVKLKKRAGASATKEKRTHLTPEEQSAFISGASIPEHHRLPILFSMYTGIRQGELSHNVLDDLQVEGPDPHLYVRFARPNLPPKNGKMRRVPLIPQAIPIARRWLEILPEYAPDNPDKLIFPTPLGKRRGVGKPLGRTKVDGKHVCAWAVAKQTAGLSRPFRWHDLRHTCGTSLLAGTWGRRWTLEEVREMLGHASVKQTEIYAHVAEETLRKAARETVETTTTATKEQLAFDFSPRSVGPGLVRSVLRAVRAVREAIRGAS